jgi:hypothetical protein
MMLHTITRKDLLDLVYRREDEFLASIRRIGPKKIAVG